MNICCSEQRNGSEINVNIGKPKTDGNASLSALSWRAHAHNFRRKQGRANRQRRTGQVAQPSVGVLQSSVCNTRFCKFLRKLLISCEGLLESFDTDCMYRECGMVLIRCW